MPASSPASYLGRKLSLQTIAAEKTGLKVVVSIVSSSSQQQLLSNIADYDAVMCTNPSQGFLFKCGLGWTQAS